MSGSTRWLAWVVVLLVMALGSLAWFLREPPKPLAKVVATQPSATLPTTQASVSPARRVISEYIDLVKLTYPEIAAAPGDRTVSLNEASHFVFDQPVYLCSRGDLWMSHPKAPELRDLYRTLSRQQVHVLKQVVLFAHWHVNDEGNFEPWIVFADSRNAAAKVFCSGAVLDLPAGKAFLWSQAVSLNDRIIVPTENGACTLWVERNTLQEQFQELGRRVRLLVQGQSAYAWAAGGKMARYTQNTWRVLADNVIQPIPLWDGSVLKIVSSEAGGTALDMQVIDASAVDEKQVNDLVARLSDDNLQTRENATADLVRVGPSAWPILEKLHDDLPPEARVRVEMVLAAKREPSLFQYIPVDGKFETVATLRDGGSVLFAPAGFTVQNTSEDVSMIAPAYLAINAGPRVTLLGDRMTHDFGKGQIKMYSWLDEWVVSDAAHGPRRFVGNSYENLVRKEEIEFGDFVGIDRQGRWIFSDPATARTLLIDPTVADSAPIMPVWEILVTGGSAGWDNHDWPVMKSGGDNVWSLLENGWQSAPKDGSVTAMQELPAAAPRAAESPILTDATGNQYFDGKTSLQIVRRDGSRTTWPLPDNASGSIEPRLFRTKSGELLLYNSPGRVLKIVATPKGSEPFKIAATFTRKVPNIESPTRLWLDPADRLIFFYDKNKLSICFPSGLVPQSIRNMMPAETDE